MNVKIIVAAHKLYEMPEDTLYLPVHVGSAGKSPLPYQPDDTGDNISAKKPKLLRADWVVLGMEKSGL